MEHKPIFPSLISAPDMLDLRSLINKIDGICDGYHIDIMDYHFVPNLTWGPMFANAIRTASHKQIWVDLLVEHPETYIPDLQLNHGDSITFHIESEHDDTIIKQIHDAEYFAGAGISPETPLEHLTPYIEHVDHILLMSVTPGFSGQDFAPNSVARLQQLAKWRSEHNLELYIAMDGGIDAHNITELSQNGANMFAIGSGIFDADDLEHRMSYLQELTTHKAQK